jgi:hypothetical protein
VSECVTCARPVNDAYLCATCATTLERALADLPSLDRDLEVTFSRQSRLTRNVGARSGSRPLPWDERAASARESLRGTLSTTVRDLATDADPWPADHVAAMVGWLLARIQRIRQHAAADEIVTDVQRILDAGNRICSGSPLAIYAGPCQGSDQPCGAELYVEASYDEKTETAKPIRPTIECAHCGTVTDVKAQREYLLAEIDGMLVGAATAARVLSALGIEVPSSTIRTWKDRGQLLGRGLDREGHETYLISEIRALHEAAQRRMAKRRERMAL